jgi:hypothetical protein
MSHGEEDDSESILGSLIIIGWCRLVDGLVELIVPVLPGDVMLAPVAA